MSARCSIDNPTYFLTSTTVATRVDFGQDVDWVYINADVDIYLVLGNACDDGTTAANLPTTKARIPSGVCHPYRVTRQRVCVAGIAGAANVSILPLAKDPVDRKRAIDHCITG